MKRYLIKLPVNPCGFKEKACGARASVSIFLSLTLVLVLSFCMMLVESARENTLLLKAELVFDTGIHSLMGEYQKELWEQYDLLYVDCSYRTDTPDYGKVKGHLQTFVDRNLEKGSDGNWLTLSFTDSIMTDVGLATDNCGQHIYLQAVEAAKEQSGMAYLEKLTELLEHMEVYSQVQQDILSGMEESSEAIASVQGTQIEVKEAEWGTDANGNRILLKEAEYETVQIENPLEKIVNAGILVRAVFGTEDMPSEAQFDLSEYASHRTLAAGTDAATEESGWGGIVDRIWFAYYLSGHFPSYTDGAEEGLFCRLEYLIGGQNSDYKNMERVLEKLLLLREVDQYLLLIQDEAKCGEARAMAQTASLLVPWIEPFVYQAILIYWAYENSLEDLGKLVTGEKIPAFSAVKLEAFQNVQLDYEQYLLILLLFTQREDMVMRMVDMIEMDIRETIGGFCMDACIYKALFTGTFTDYSGRTYAVDGTLAYS